jgi:predicted RNA methylase
VVRPGDVVVDIGTGTGILAIAAARAGARRVFAIEATGAAEVAAAMIRQNGVADRVTVIRGWSTSVDLPERGDVVMSEILGDDPFREGVLESTSDAFHRLLKPSARRIPLAVTVWALPVEVAPTELERHTVSAASIERWRERYGLDFSALSPAAARGTTVGIKPTRVRAWRRLGSARPVVRVELAPNAPEMLEEQIELPVSHAGACQGVVTFFEAELCAGIVVSTDPWLDSASHWLNPTLLLPEPRRVDTGDVIRVRYRYPASPPLELVE